MENKDDSRWIANLLLVVFLCSLFYFGWFVKGRSLSDSDSCWLLGLGRWMVEHRSLPMVDPFSSGVSSFATLSPGTPLVQYQWLAEVLFYSIYNFGGLFGLISLVSFIAAVTFVCLPFACLSKFDSHRVILFVFILAGTGLVSYCMFVRPQAFSNLFIAILIYLYLPTSTKLKHLRWTVVFSTMIIMLLWTNMHIFFPLGIIFISIILGARFIETKTIDRGKDFALSQFVIPLLAVLPTFINPWGWGIWTFLHRIASNSNSDLITELKPLKMFSFHDPMSSYMWILIIVYVGLCLHFRAFKISRLGFVSPLLFIFALYLSLEHLRMVPITTLFIMAACVELYSRQPVIKFQSSSSSRLAALWHKIDSRLRRELSRRYAWLSTMLITVMLGSTVAFCCTPTSFPQPSELFAVPFKAIDYLKIHRPAGKFLNDPRFGSLMNWYLNNPDVFIDTRFSQYDPERLPESIHMEDCEYSWKDIWKKYNFDWVFIKPSRPLVKALRERDWKTVYEDDQSVILTKP